MRLTETPDFLNLPDGRLDAGHRSAIAFGIGHGVVAYFPCSTHIKLFYALIRRLGLTASDLRVGESFLTGRMDAELRVCDESRMIVLGDSTALRARFISWAATHPVSSVGGAAFMNQSDEPEAPQRTFWEVAGRAWSTPSLTVISTWPRDVSGCTSPAVLRDYGRMLGHHYADASGSVVLEVFDHPVPFNLEYSGGILAASPPV
jgi:hypothetical protein